MDKKLRLSPIGYCDVVSATSFEGWAYDGSLPNEPLLMQVIIDGTFVASVKCNLLRLDVAAAGVAPQQVGFIVRIPPNFQDGDNHVIEFRDADGSPILLADASGVHQSWLLPSTTVLHSTAAQPSTIIGHLDEIHEHRAQGWAYDPAAPDIPVTLDVLIDGVVEASVVCDFERADVADAGHPVSCAGFQIDLPNRHFDDRSHVLEVRPQSSGSSWFGAASGQNGMRRMFCLPAESIVGHIDGLCDNAVRGWVFMHDRKSGTKRGALQLLVTMQGHLIAQISAREFRMEVATAHGCDPNCGFAFFPPAQLVAGRIVELDFTVIPGGHRLPGGPVRVDFPSLETVAVLRDLRDVTDKLFSELWFLRDRIRRLVPDDTYTLDNYDLWARQYQKALKAVPDQIADLLPAGGSPAPLVSIICPVYKPRLQDFVAAVVSVRAQTYRNWELVIVDDASGSVELTTCIESFARQDARIRARTLPKNRGISGATNAAVAQATGSYVAFFDHDDLLEDRAIEFMLAGALRTGAQMIYSDEDKIDDNGVFSDVNFKPDWNYRLLLAQNYVCHLLMVGTEYLLKAGPFRKKCDGSQDHDIILRLSEIIPHNNILHVPEVLYHWRKTPMSTAASGQSKPYSVLAGIRAIQDHVDRKRLAGRVHSPRGITCYEIDWQLGNSPPTIAIIIPYREQVGTTRACLEALWTNTDYANYQVILVDNWSTSDEALAFSAEMSALDDVSVMRVEEPYNFARLNNLAVAASTSELLLFMNNDVFVSDPAWLRSMVGELLADPLVGIVGNKLLYKNRLVQHGGVILGVGGVADHAHRGLGADEPGYAARAICAQDISAVTAACMLCRRAVFDSVGGFDEQDLKIAFNDVDLCLKVGMAGFRIIWTPNSMAEHWEGFSRGSDFRPDQQARFFHEHETMSTRWKEIISMDRHYHRAFSRKSGIFMELEAPSISCMRTTESIPSHENLHPIDKIHTPKSRQETSILRIISNSS